MLRSFRVALVLVIPEVVVQVLFLEVVLIAGFTATLHIRPWRVEYANVIDYLFGAATLLVVCLASLYISDDMKNLKSVAYVTCFVILAVMALVPFAVVWGVYQRFFRKVKPYQFFLCHHKAAAGAFTRLLKMQLKDTGKLLSDVFVDSDNLENLDNLFDYVGNGTMTLTVIATEMIFTRPWCVGEMNTARMKHVNTVLVAMPSYHKPDEKFIQELEQRIVNLEVLIEHGMDIDMLEVTMTWISQQPQIEMPSMLSFPVLDGLISILLSARAGQHGTVRPSNTGPMVAEAVFCCDQTNAEAVASAMVLQKMLAPTLASSPQKIPAMLEMDEIPDFVQCALFLCTNGCFSNACFLNYLLQVQSSEGRCSMLPVLAEATFTFPSKDTLKGWAAKAPEGLPESSGIALAQMTLVLFKEIAATFQPHHASETILHVNSQDIARRLLSLASDIKTTKTRSMITMKASGSTAATTGNAFIVSVGSSATVVTARAETKEMNQEKINPGNGKPWNTHFFNFCCFFLLCFSLFWGHFGAGGDSRVPGCIFLEH
eukprot:1762599-Amphidinium_carterae.1